MELEAYHQALLTLCFAPAPGEGMLPGFELYRDMVRARLLGMARVAFRRAFALTGDAAASASFARYLARTPPDSPLIREVIGGFAAHVESDRALLAGAPDEALDTFRFEAAKWRVASALEQPLTSAPGEVEFDRVLVLNTTLTLLPLAHPVWEESDAARARRDPHTLLVYRRPGQDEVRWYRAPALLACMFELHLGAARPLAELVQEAVAERRERVDEALLEQLASGLTTAVERGVVLGAYAPS